MVPNTANNAKDAGAQTGAANAGRDCSAAKVIRHIAPFPYSIKGAIHPRRIIAPEICRRPV